MYEISDFVKYFSTNHNDEHNDSEMIVLDYSKPKSMVRKYILSFLIKSIM